MKDAKHHLKHVQRKIMKSVKKEEPVAQEAQPKNPAWTIQIKRPKTILNKRKTAL